MDVIIVGMNGKDVERTQIADFTELSLLLDRIFKVNEEEEQEEEQEPLTERIMDVLKLVPFEIWATLQDVAELTHADLNLVKKTMKELFDDGRVMIRKDEGICRYRPVLGD